MPRLDRSVTLAGYSPPCVCSGCQESFDPDHPASDGGAFCARCSEPVCPLCWCAELQAECLCPACAEVEGEE